MDSSSGISAIVAAAIFQSHHGGAPSDGEEALQSSKLVVLALLSVIFHYEWRF